jgi:hypothetical protein
LIIRIVRIMSSLHEERREDDAGASTSALDADFHRRRDAAEAFLEARFLGIVGTEFVAEKLAAGRAPGLELAVHDRQRLAAERAARHRIDAQRIHIHQMPPGVT